MEYRRLGKSGLRVSTIGLGTMTLGGMVSAADSIKQLDRAFDGGINLIDTAEQYASPPTAKSYGSSEKIIGRWLKSKPRDSVILATKLSGPSVEGSWGMPHIRHGLTAFDRFHLETAIDASLVRLKTDYVDLYQTHWPDRETPMLDQLEAMERLIESGKVRYFGASNETAWGLTKLITIANAHGLPSPVGVQNPYSLVQRDDFEAGLSEVCERENVGLMAYSVLAMGALTGKYSGSKFPKGSRLAKFDYYRDDWGYGSRRVLELADRYAAIGKEVGLSAIELAIAWVTSRPFTATALSSCTSLRQLDGLLKVADVSLSTDTLATIDAVHSETKLQFH
tara:strand:+ start:1124 stop:2134 length:1011 start_codon:yes stop_codon:yes gene_type:complete